MQGLSKSGRGLFASKSVIAHLLRGTVGMLLIAWAIRHQADTGWSLAAGLAALIAFRGCPVCWTIGLLETLAQKARQRAAERA